MKIQQPVSVVILAAGNSSRMNSPKPFLPFDDDRNFIQKIIETYVAAGIEDIILVINKDMERRLRLILAMNYPSFNIDLVINRFPERGRFYSIQLGLKKIKNEICFLQNIDNPFITEVLLNEMIKAVKKTNHVVPAFRNKDGHPVLIGNDIKTHLLSLEGDQHNLRAELKYFSKIKILWLFENILANINTRKEYGKYFLRCETPV